MGGSMWFISLLRDYPLIGILIGLVFFAFMFASKNLVVYFYAKHKEKLNKAEKENTSPVKTETKPEK